MTSFAQALQIVYYVVAIGGIVFAIIHYRKATQRKEFSDLLEISNLVRSSMREFEDNKDTNEKYWFLELLGTFELICGIHNKNLISNFTKEFVQNYIAQHLEAYSSEDRLAEYIQTLNNDKGAFDEIRSFVSGNHILFNDLELVKKVYSVI